LDLSISPTAKPIELSLTEAILRKNLIKIRSESVQNFFRYGIFYRHSRYTKTLTFLAWLTENE